VSEGGAFTMQRLPSWTEVIKPDLIVFSERLDESLFAADLYSVWRGDAPREYQDPKRFAEQTYPTEGMVQLLSDVVKRLSGKGATNPVIQIQTPFGGGKTHTLIALYHLVKHRSAIKNSSLGEKVLEKAGLKSFPEAKVAVFVGTVPNPKESLTPWGEIAWQLGRYDVVRGADEGRYSPGRELLEKAIGDEPVLILIDEIAEFAARCEDEYYTQLLAFCHELTEAVKNLRRCCLVVTLPSSAPYGEKGLRALRELEEIFGRMQAIYEPVAGMEIYEVVRRRLFEMDGGWDIDAYRVVDEYISTYRQWSDAPEWAKSEDYREKMLRAYPFHPLLIDWLSERWGSFHTFQRTRGVLRFLGHIVQDIWRKHEKERQKADPLIQPCHVNLSKPEIVEELIRHIGAQYRAVIDADVKERAPRIDSGMGDWSQYQVATGLATSIFLASFIAAGEDKRAGVSLSELKVALWRPGLEPAVITEALNSLERSLLYLHERDGLYLFNLEPSLVRLKIDYMERITPEEIRRELERRLKELVKETGDWQVRITDKPEDVPDVRDLQMVVFPPDKPYQESEQFREQVKRVFETKGNTPRVYRNALVVVVADKSGIENAEQKVREFLALKRIEGSEERKKLSQRDQQRLKEEREAADNEAPRQLCNAYRFVFKVTGKGVEWIDMGVMSIGESMDLVRRVQSHLHQRDLLMTEKVNPYQVKELMGSKKERPLEEIWEDYGKFPRLPMLLNRGVLAEAVRIGVRERIFAVQIGGREYYGDFVPPSGSDWVKEAVLLAEPTLESTRVETPEIETIVPPVSATVEVEDILAVWGDAPEVGLKEIYSRLWAQKRSSFRSEAEFREAFIAAVRKGSEGEQWQVLVGKSPITGEKIDISVIERGTLRLLKAKPPREEVVRLHLRIPSDRFGEFARTMANLYRMGLVGDQIEVIFQSKPLNGEQRRQLRSALKETVSQLGGKIQEPSDWR